MGQERLKEVPKLKEWPHFSAHRWFIRLRQAYRHQSWTWWKTQIIDKWANDVCRFEVETSVESAHFDSEKDESLPWACQQEDRLTALYPDISEVIVHRKLLTQCADDLEHAVKSRTTEQYSTEDIINILQESTTRTMISSSRVNIKTRFNTPMKDSVDKSPKENSNSMKYKSEYTIRKCHIFERTTNIVNTFPKR
ncbi:hypothetical protein O181_095520 [Austropuccinia psidii MF-1]|uniref:Uncharacterized protein n=1 Tax=Austropuccinia psidii MF-1 TaxID=1389203 RepID=A0A9Q3J5S4_9BASI|nr:hypothetical protein [Austropuccinia psidii MF-1]